MLPSLKALVVEPAEVAQVQVVQVQAQVLQAQAAQAQVAQAQVVQGLVELLRPEVQALLQPRDPVLV